MFVCYGRVINKYFKSTDKVPPVDVEVGAILTEEKSIW